LDVALKLAVVDAGPARICGVEVTSYAEVRAKMRLRQAFSEAVNAVSA